MSKKASMAMERSAAPSAAGRGGSIAADDDQGAGRMAVAPILASFSAFPPAVTAGVATDVTWSFQYSNEPWPNPTCTVDNGVGRVNDGVATKVQIEKTTDYTLTCVNSAGRAARKITINAVKIEAKYDVAEYQIVMW